ncbi:hypothetical protein [Phyllobacterium pellucidum]|uniref:hypothetical protein n=1 Tax=Phyllobacterium pellucidum TaxID=2740464 RepID=UPI001D15428F|nr:hypothetical protein [Phyllobacterium sp. T1018]UGY08970.1 hypothetical protein LLE51_013190 [Phyllobacterium sp. T1018]
MRFVELLSGMMLAIVASILFLSPASAGEKLGFPPPDPPGTVRTPMTPQNIQKELDQRLKRQFEAAAGPSGRLTAQQAKDAGWGFIADHFDEISRGNGDTVGLNEIQSFMDARSPVARTAEPSVAPKKKGKTTEPPKPVDNSPIQIIE